MQSKLLYSNKLTRLRKVFEIDFNGSPVFTSRFISNTSKYPSSPQLSSATKLSPRPNNDSKRIQPTLETPNKWSHYARSLATRYAQPTFKVNNEFYEDPLLYSWLSHNLPKEIQSEILRDLEQLGARVSTNSPLNSWSQECERVKPQLERIAADGRRVDTVHITPGWSRLRHFSAREGIVSTAYERKFGPWSRVYQLCKLYLFSPSAGLYPCPLAMTDGAAKVLEPLVRVAPTPSSKPPRGKKEKEKSKEKDDGKHDSKSADKASKSTGATDVKISEKPISSANSGLISDSLRSRLAEAYARLISRDPNRFWTSGQWMTERRGGSDVAESTETVAVPAPDGNGDLLYGYKFFSSACDSDMALALARPLQPESNEVLAGTGGLALYYLECRQPPPPTDDRFSADLVAFDQLRGPLAPGLLVEKLKEKMGTRQLPTAELLLDGVRAHRLSETGRGVPSIAPMLTITRIHNAIGSVAAMRRAILLAMDFSRQRTAFGKKLQEHPLHQRTLARLDRELRAGFLFVMNVALLLGKEECGEASAADSELLRLLTPLVKLYTGKQVVPVVSEAMEATGALGYMEDSGFPNILRDSQVFPIWEVTTNVLCLDVLRALRKSNMGALDVFVSRVNAMLDAALLPQANAARSEAGLSLGDCATACRRGAEAVRKHLREESPETIEAYARDLCLSLGRVYAGALLIEWAARPSASDEDRAIAAMWALRPFLHFYSLTPV